MFRVKEYMITTEDLVYRKGKNRLHITYLRTGHIFYVNIFSYIRVKVPKKTHESFHIF